MRKFVFLVIKIWQQQKHKHYWYLRPDQDISSNQYHNLYFVWIRFVLRSQINYCKRNWLSLLPLNRTTTKLKSVISLRHHSGSTIIEIKKRTECSPHSTGNKENCLSFRERTMSRRAILCSPFFFFFFWYYYYYCCWCCCCRALVPHRCLSFHLAAHSSLA